MSQLIPKEYLDLREKPAFAHPAALMADGSPRWRPLDGPPTPAASRAKCAWPTSSSREKSSRWV